MQTRVKEVVREAIQPNPFRCAHVKNWPDTSRILMGIDYCPYCVLAMLQDDLAKLQKNYDFILKEHNRAAEFVSKLNAANTALQIFAMKYCDTEQRVAELLRINQGQYDATI